MSDATDNPFASSDAAVGVGGGELMPLYSEASCMATTFFGTPVLAAPLLMINASRTGQSPFAIGGLAIAIFVGAVIIGMVPLPIPGVVFTVAQVMLVKQLHQSWFQLHVMEREEAGVAPAPWLHAAGLCLVGFTAGMLFVGLLIWAVGLEGLADL